MFLSKIGGAGLLLILAIVLLLFGGKKIRNLGSDLGEGLKGFKKSIKDEDADTTSKSESEDK